MPNNFRIDGNYYVSKAGHDSNDALTKDTPKKSLPASPPAGDIVVGSGSYISSTLITATGGRITGDGEVIIDGNAGNVLTNQNGVNKYYELTVSNALIININAAEFYRCKFSNISSLNGTSTNIAFGISEDCIFINITEIVRRKFRRCIIINSAVIQTLANMYVSDTYIDRLATVSFAVNPAPNNFINNNCQGLIVLAGAKYVIKDQLSGTPQDNGYASDVFWLTEANLTANGYTGTITGWNAAVATCINRDPRFNDASKMDFTLKADSPHIGRSSDGVRNIGGTSYAQSFYAGGSNPNILLLQPSVEIDTTSNMTDWKLKPGEVEGTIRAIVKVANTDEVITKIPYVGNFAFNSNDTPGTPTNFNVPDSKPSTNNYPDFRLTTGTASDTLRVVITNHGYSAGIWLKVDGQYREVTSVTQNELIFTTAVRAIVGAEVSVQVGTEGELASLNPNRLNVLMRSSRSIDVNSGNWDNAMTWDNDGLAPSGQYLAQEWGSQPLIDNLNQVGFGDDNFDTNYSNPIQLKVVDLLIFLRNNYRS